MKQYGIYLLDADNTLFDFLKAERRAFSKTFESLAGEPCSEELYACYNRINASLWEALERREITKPQLQQTRFGLFLKKQGLSGDGLTWNETYLDHLSEGNFLFDGALEVCRALSQKAALYLATNGITRVQKKRLRDSAIAPYIRGIFVSEEAGAEKPSPLYFDYVMKQLGVRYLIVTNACGGINKSFKPGDLMIITDHINFSANNSLIGINDDRLGPRFPDMTEAYNRELIHKAQEIADHMGLEYEHGVYIFFPGPCFETAAEIRAFAALGADAVGMSTVPEVIAANYLGIKVLGISCITNMATGISKTKHDHAEVLKTADRASENLCSWVRELVSRW